MQKETIAQNSFEKAKAQFIDNRWPHIKQRWPGPLRCLEKIQQNIINNRQSSSGQTPPKTEERLAQEMAMSSEASLKYLPPTMDGFPERWRGDLRRAAIEAGIRCTPMEPVYDLFRKYLGKNQIPDIKL
jgi:hypothetical protein